VRKEGEGEPREGEKGKEKVGGRERERQGDEKKQSVNST